MNFDLKVSTPSFGQVDLFCLRSMEIPSGRQNWGIAFFRDGTRDGLRSTEIPSRSVMGVACRRKTTNQAMESIRGLDRPGVYMLVGEQIGFSRRPSVNDGDPRKLIVDEQNESPPSFFGLPVYVGEAQNVRGRLSQHLARGNGENHQHYSYWEYTLAFVSKDDLLTRGHALWLERMLIDAISRSTSAVSMNGKGSSDKAGGLGEIDKVFCEHYFNDVRTLAFALGYRFLEDISASASAGTARIAEGAGDGPEEVLDKAIASDQPIYQGPTFTLHLPQSPNIRGSLRMTEDDEYVVLRESTGPRETVPSLSPTYKNLRDVLIANESIIVDGDNIFFDRDVVFKSIAAATQVLTGSTVNGRVAWRDGEHLLGDFA